MKFGVVVFPGSNCDDDKMYVHGTASNPNGSLESIAGICNQGRNVLGMMPHPERASAAILGNSDGKALFDSLLQHAASLTNA